MRSESSGWYAPMLTLFVALLLSIVALPQVIAPFRPDWVAVIVLYWTLIEPRRFMLLTAFALGIVLDALSGSLLGQHSLALLVIVFLTQRFYLPVRTSPASQMALFIIAMLGLYEFLLLWIDGVAGRSVPLIERWGPVVSSSLLWVLVMLSVDRGRQAAEARM